MAYNWRTWFLSGCLVGLPRFALVWSIEPVPYCIEVIAVSHYLNGSAKPLNLIADRLCGEFIFYIYCWAFWQMKGRWVLSTPGYLLKICSIQCYAFHCGLCLRKLLPSVGLLWVLTRLSDWNPQGPEWSGKKMDSGGEWVRPTRQGFVSGGHGGTGGVTSFGWMVAAATWEALWLLHLTALHSLKALSGSIFSL